MVSQKLYDCLLDFFPLVDEIIQESPVLGSVLQVTMLDALDNPELLSKVRLLLGLSVDLGYASPEVVRFLERRLHPL